MDAALRLGLGHPLDPVGSALVLVYRVGTVTPDLEGHVLEPALLGGRLGEHLGRVSALRGVAGQHLVEIAREERRFVATGPGPDFDDHVLVVVRVRLDHGQADLLFQFLKPGRSLANDLFEFLVLILLEKLARPLEVVAQGPVLGDQTVGGLHLTVLAADFCVAITVPDHLGVAHLLLELGKPRLDLFRQLLDHKPILTVATAGGRLPVWAMTLWLWERVLPVVFWPTG